MLVTCKMKAASETLYRVGGEIILGSIILTLIPCIFITSILRMTNQCTINPLTPELNPSAQRS
jgi:hypothetical protein